MGEVRPPQPVTPFVATLSATPEMLARARAAVECVLGPVTLCSARWPLTVTDYYAAEMGAGLQRQFWAFAGLVPAADLPDWKLATNAIEKDLSEAGCRRVNLDPGYVNFPHVALASTKAFSHRLHLRDGIYGEVTLQWRGQEYMAFPWTFPEYRSSRVQGFLRQVRDAYALTMRERAVA